MGIELCYLCDEPLAAKRSADHVPPQQFCAPTLRRLHNLDRLVTLPTHSPCNEGYGRDEEYVVNAFAPAAGGSVAADALIQHHANRYRAGEAGGRGEKILRSFEDRPGGLHLPHGLIVMRVEEDRIKRVIWKIVRGLHFIEFGKVLPLDTRFLVEVKEPENRAPSQFNDLWELVKAQPSKGAYQGVFAYKHFAKVAEGSTRHIWGMLWWDRVMVFVYYGIPVPE